MKLFTASLRLAALAFLLLGAVDTVVAAGLETGGRRSPGLRHRQSTVAATGEGESRELSPDKDKDQVLADKEHEQQRAVAGSVAGGDDNGLERARKASRAYWANFLASESKLRIVGRGLGALAMSPIHVAEWAGRGILAGGAWVGSHIGAGCRRGCPRRAVAAYDTGAAAVAARYAQVDAWLATHPVLQAIHDNAYDVTTRTYYVLTVVALVTGSVPACDPATLIANLPACLGAVPMAFQAPVTAMVAALVAAIEAAPAVGTQLMQNVTKLFGRGQEAALPDAAPAVDASNS